MLQVLREKVYPPQATLPDLDGSTVVVTGASSGLGLQAAIKFAQCGATKIVLGVRSLEKGNSAKESIEAAVRMAKHTVKMYVWELDMLDYDSIHAFAHRCSVELDQVNILVLNAGVHPARFARSKYGFEESLQVNVLSTQLLALLMLDKLKASNRTNSARSVLEIVSSSNYELVTDLGSGDEADVLAAFNSPTGYNGRMQYNVSKLFLMCVYLTITEKYVARDSPDIFTIAVCPGFARSDIGRSYTGLVMEVLKAGMNVFRRTSEEGARTYISGVMQGSSGHGLFWHNDEIKRPSGLLAVENSIRLREQIWASTIAALRSYEKNRLFLDKLSHS